MILFLLLLFVYSITDIEKFIENRYDSDYCKHEFNTKFHEKTIIKTDGTVFKDICPYSISIFNTTFKCYSPFGLETCRYDACITDIISDNIGGIVLFDDKFVRLWPGKYWDNYDDFEDVNVYYDLYRKFIKIKVIIYGNEIDRDNCINHVKTIEKNDMFDITYIHLYNGNCYKIGTSVPCNEILETTDDGESIHFIYYEKGNKKKYNKSIRLNGYKVNINNIFYDYRYNMGWKRLINIDKIWDNRMKGLDWDVKELWIKYHNKIKLVGIYFIHNIIPEPIINQTVLTYDVLNDTVYVNDGNTSVQVNNYTTEISVTYNNTIIYIEIPVYNTTDICCSQAIPLYDIFVYSITGTIIVSLIFITLISVLIAVLCPKKKKLVADETELKYQV